MDEMEGEMASQDLYVAGGCFWCVEGPFNLLKGVIHAESGYAGGTVPNPTYEDVCTGRTGHAEVVKITFDPKIVSAKELLYIFFTIHDPTQLNQQGNDHGTQYRSAVFYRSPAEKKLVQEVMADVTKERIWPRKLVTTLEPLRAYYRAEDYHQDYAERAAKGLPVANASYCQFIVLPKVNKFRQKYAARLKR